MDGLTATGAWSASRQLFTSYVGSFLATSGSTVTSLKDQSGNSRDLAQLSGANLPTVATVGGIAALSFDNTMVMSSNTAMTNFISASTGYMIASVKPTAFPTNNAAQYNNSAIMQGATQNAGMTVRANGGSPLYYAGNDPNYLSASIAANTPYVLEWRHEGGTLYQRVNGAGETSITSGNSSSLGNFNFGGRFLTTGFEGYIFEAATFSSVPILAARNALVQSLGTYIGASV
jgi:hypothetical protein